MDMPGVLVKELDDTLTALHISCPDIMLNGVGRRNFEVCVACLEEVNKFRV